MRWRNAEDAQRVLLAALHTLPELSQDGLRHLFRGLIWRVERVLLLAIPRLARRRALLFPVAASFVAMAAHYVLWFRDNGRLTRAEYARLIARMAVAGGKAAYREQVGKARGMGKPETPEGALLGMGRREVVVVTESEVGQKSEAYSAATRQRRRSLLLRHRRNWVPGGIHYSGWSAARSCSVPHWLARGLYPPAWRDRGDEHPETGERARIDVAEFAAAISATLAGQVRWNHETS